MKTDLYREITDQIITAIEAGVGDAELPWHRNLNGLPFNAGSGRSYQGINVLVLWVSAERYGFSSNAWATYRQWQEAGCQVQKGEASTRIVFFKELKVDDGEETFSIPIARSFRVFNADQVDGYQEPPVAVTSHESTDRFIQATGAEIRRGGDHAFYTRLFDYIQMPARELFTGTSTASATESYYATLLHELIHWTSHPSRLSRELSGRFGERAYAMEELIAELGASFLCAELGVTPQLRPDHAAYIADWLSVLRGDKRAIFTAASQASRAVEFLKGDSGS